MHKVIVFDLDETLGHFSQLSGFDIMLTNLNNKVMKKSDFYKMMDLFPNLLRPGILDIMKMLKKKKKNNLSKIKVMIYTNNNGCKMWVHRLKGYIEKKINYKIFDRVICGWKYDGKIIEPNRSGYFKSYGDLLKCGHLSRKDEILFLDDRLHEDMLHKNVSYILLTPYRYDITNEHFLKKYLSIASLTKHQKFNIKNELYRTNNGQHKSTNFKLFHNHGKKIKREIEHFLNKNTKTRKNKKKRKNKTIKI